ncbi:hypothetical protein J1N35_041983 [Gossypium stocksii]|uniref:Uncharacterized protein n=1 Tax=Gossypium stocksii TaxID=47602 RepID=A0A9D3ZJ47_9ROSI|nr:hypothetical protein J1N35_041983 [Gossypium stocksii]
MKESERKERMAKKKAKGSLSIRVEEDNSLKTSPRATKSSNKWKKERIKKKEIEGKEEGKERRRKFVADDWLIGVEKKVSMSKRLGILKEK